MKEGPDISRIAALVGDPARGNMLNALMDGRALTAGELAIEAGITKQTASSHLARLMEGRLIEREVQGRHHYYRLAGRDVAALLEALMRVADTSGTGKRTRTGPTDAAMRKARVCYDHLAGDMGVALLDRMIADKWLMDTGARLVISSRGWEQLSVIGLTPASLPRSNRPECRTCLDWSVRRHHLAGSAGKLILDQFFALGWAQRQPATRAIIFSGTGERRFRELIG
ncbi:ArsR/SmtB family transcription factor [Gimibacter soli]|uniref:Helix-turn-helix transcriptional regulator n=1 Tax=Gimibacter soli TaxID=3024400 RepID=A0AAE9XT95_9PROT|nr:helix-turn-helix transcriptional regulator [Gimibacter soli]WCL54730.1 helix-turn-helix transcriptional regulator [Gimibacter soli]